MFDRLFDVITPLEKGLDASWLRGQVISNNLANVDTPHFKASSVEFESVFRAALKQSSSSECATGVRRVARQLEGVSARVVQNRKSSLRLDGNNVDIDAENALLAKNTLYYNTLVQKLNAEFRKLSMAIHEGR